MCIYIYKCKIRAYFASRTFAKQIRVNNFNSFEYIIRLCMLGLQDDAHLSC